MARIVTCSLRISWAYFPHNIKLAIAAQVFVAAGVVIIFIVNLVFAQRMIRASHPSFGWNPLLGSWTFKTIYLIIFLTITMLITATVDAFYVLSPYIHNVDRSIQLYGVTCFAVIAFLPIPMVLLLLAIPRHHPLQKFGKGHWRTKPTILLVGTTLLSFGAIYRAVTTWLTPVPLMQPLPHYFHKAAFYVVNFAVEILVVYLYAFTRVDQHFHVPDGSKNRKSYIMPQSDEESGTLPSIKLNKSQDTFGDQSTLAGGQTDMGDSRRDTKDLYFADPSYGASNGEATNNTYNKEPYFIPPPPTARTHISLNQPMHIPTFPRHSQQYPYTPHNRRNSAIKTSRRQSKGVFSLIYSDLPYDQRTSRVLAKDPPASISKPWMNSGPRTSIEDLRNVVYNPLAANTYRPSSSAFKPRSSMSHSRFSTFVQNDDYDYARVEPLQFRNRRSAAKPAKRVSIFDERISVYDSRGSMIYDPRGSMIYNPRTSSIYTQTY
jgi:hypothetical protein